MCIYRPSRANVLVWGGALLLCISLRSADPGLAGEGSGDEPKPSPNPAIEMPPPLETARKMMDSR